jgi:histidinol-phosphate aminotransferase
MTDELADPLRHHGDVEAEPGLLDFAVNVRGRRPPPWLLERLTDALQDIGRYPSAAADLAARTAVAARHGRRPEEVLLLSGAAEAFTLIPRLRPDLAAVLHPSFTEPEAALRAARVPITRVMLSGDFRLDEVPDEADLVVLGNPTNPTSVLHSAASIRRLVRPGRLVLVDEAFADAVVDERESLAAQRIPGVLVLRSLTKTWALAGLRAGYLLGDPALLRRLHDYRPQWPVSTLAVAAVQACNEPAALRDTAAQAVAIAHERAEMIAKLEALQGVTVHTPAEGPFLLLTVTDGPGTRKALRDKGIAVRRADTFPGLGPDHLRVAVRASEDVDTLVEALRAHLETTP